MVEQCCKRNALCGAVKALYVMGGSAHKGNITPTAEFNFFCDPEAAHLVLKKVNVWCSLHACVLFFCDGMCLSQGSVLPPRCPYMHLVACVEQHRHVDCHYTYLQHWHDLDFIEALKITLLTQFVCFQFPQTTLITWDCCMRHATPWIVVDNWFKRVSTACTSLPTTLCFGGVAHRTCQLQ